jgi:hypothetical protein
MPFPRIFSTSAESRRKFFDKNSPHRLVNTIEKKHEFLSRMQKFSSISHIKDELKMKLSDELTAFLSACESIYTFSPSISARFKDYFLGLSVCLF